MAVDKGKILVGVPDRVTGAVMNAAVGTALPTSVSGSVASFTDCGYISDGGLVTAHTLNTTVIHDWGGDIVRNFVNTADGKITFAFLEQNTQSSTAFWGGSNVTVTAPTGGAGNLSTILVNGQDPDHKAWVFNVKDGLRKKRICVPDAQVMSRGPISYTKSAAAMYQVDLTPYPDSSGNVWYEYFDDGEITGSSVPVITSITPTGQGAAQLVTIAGNGFTGVTAIGVTGVKFGGTNAAAYTVFNDNTIVASLPAGSAGLITVLVTNASGGSTATNNYTRAV